MFSLGASAVLRKMALTTGPGALDLQPSAGEVWGVLMETGYPDAVVTPVVLADVSIYFSNGGGIFGLGFYPGPEKEAKALISLAQKFSGHAAATESYPLPQSAYTRFYFRIGTWRTVAISCHSPFMKDTS